MTNCSRSDEDPRSMTRRVFPSRSVVAVYFNDLNAQLIVVRIRAIVERESTGFAPVQMYLLDVIARQ